MAIKKSELYSSIWAGCDALRGSMDASQYKDYVLVLLFVKYVSDKYSNDPNALIEVPEGCRFRDFVALKGNKDIGEKIDTAIGVLAKANDLENVIDVVSFNDEEKLGKGKEMVDRLSDLIAIFEKPELDFGKNRANNDDILGDAYEYLMRHFATESGKSKGQFYTPAEVSRVLAKVLGIKAATNNTTFYDPTCGSGSLLLKLIEEADGIGTLYGQEKDITTAALSRMNMILHGQPTAQIARGQSTLSNPFFRDNNGFLKTFDYVVANPPFSLKNWSQGFNPFEDEYSRFDGFGIPPDKNGDYAFLLHIVKSLKSTGKGAVILPHGVLFRGNAEAEIRKNLIKKGYIKGIIGLPPNLFYGTGIPACIIVLDKEGAEARTGIFMIDAGKGYIKDGNKNRLREQDIHKIVDVFNRQLEIPKYSRFVPLEEIADKKNDYNLNIPRYIDTQETEDIQDIEAHLLGDIPSVDIDALGEYWQVYPVLKEELFGASRRAGYVHLKVDKDQIKHTIFHHSEFKAFTAEMNEVFEEWNTRTTRYLKELKVGDKPKEVIHAIAEDLLQTYHNRHLMDKYDVYQHLMNYWNEMMQDDCYLIAAEGWKAEVYRIMVKNKKGVEQDKGWACDLVPAQLVIDRYFSSEQGDIYDMESKRDEIVAQLEELVEEHSGEEGYFADMEKVNKVGMQKRLKEIYAAKAKVKSPQLTYSHVEESGDLITSVSEEVTEEQVMNRYMSLTEQQGELDAKIKKAKADLDKMVLEKYPKLAEEEIKELVVDDKWMNTIDKAIHTEMDRISQRLTHRIKELAERYDTPLPQLNQEVAELEEKVNAHLINMGLQWN